MNRKATDLEVDGVDMADYPDFADSYFSQGTWVDTNEPMTGDELEKYADDNAELLFNMAYESCL